MSEATDKPPAGLRQFQQSFSQQLRQGNTASASAECRAGAIYRNLLYNNICGFVDRCFPVACRVLPQDRWQELCESFFRQARCESPLFRDIPRQFLEFVQETDTALTPWLPELLHYEWIELVVDSHPAAVTPVGPRPADESRLAVNPTLQNLQYRWPVHTLSPESLPEHPQPSCLLVYRRSDHRVTFLEVPPLAAALLQLLAQMPDTAAGVTDLLCDLWPEGVKADLKLQVRQAITRFLADEILFAEEPNL